MTRAATDLSGDRPRVKLTEGQRHAVLDALRNNGVLSPRTSSFNCHALERLGLIRSKIESWPGFGVERVWRLTSAGYEMAEMLRPHRGRQQH